MAYKVVV